MQPRYVTVTSSGSSPWQTTNWHITPFKITFSGRASGLRSNWQLDVTMDDPSGVYPSTAGAPLIFGASQISSALGVTSSNVIGSITVPITAWRVTNSSTGGAITVTALQAGIG